MGACYLVHENWEGVVVMRSSDEGYVFFSPTATTTDLVRRKGKQAVEVSKMCPFMHMWFVSSVIVFIFIFNHYD